MTAKPPVIDYENVDRMFAILSEAGLPLTASEYDKDLRAYLKVAAVDWRVAKARQDTNIDKRILDALAEVNHVAGGDVYSVAKDRGAYELVRPGNNSKRVFLGNAESVGQVVGALRMFEAGLRERAI